MDQKKISKWLNGDLDIYIFEDNGRMYLTDRTFIYGLDLSTIKADLKRKLLNYLEEFLKKERHYYIQIKRLKK